MVAASKYVAITSAQAATFDALLLNHRVAPVSPWFLPADFYANSVNGSDDNDGRSPALAFKTLARTKTAMLSFGEGVRVGLIAGSDWHESFKLDELTDKTVYGWGPIATLGFPVIRGDDVIEGTWENNVDRGDGYDKVYSQLWTFEIDPNQQALPPNVYAGDTVDDVRLKTWAASEAECQALPGSFYHDGDLTATSPVMIYIHPLGSTNPNTNGKVYTATKRNWALKMGDGGKASFIFTRNQGHDNGSINGGDDVLVDGCLATGSPIHDMLLASGAYRRCVFWHDYSDVRTGAIAGEFYRANANGKHGLFDRCYGKGVPTGTVKVFGGHVDSPSDSTNYASMTARDSYADNGDAYFDNTNLAIAERLKIEDGQLRWLSASTAGAASHIDVYAIATGARGAGPISGSVASSRLHIEGLRAYVTGDFPNGILAGMYNYDMERSIISLNNDTSSVFARDASGDAVNFENNQCLFEYTGIGTPSFYSLINASILPSGENNVFAGWGNWRISDGGNITYTTLGALQSAQGIEVGSLAVDKTASLGANVFGTPFLPSSFPNNGWSIPVAGSYEQSGTGNGAADRLQWTVAAGTYEVIFTISGAGTLTLRQGGTTIAAGLGAGTHTYRFAVAANINFVPSGTACTLSAASAKLIPANLKNPIYVTDPANGDWTIVGDTGDTGVGLERPNVSYMPKLLGIEDAQRYILTMF